MPVESPTALVSPEQFAAYMTPRVLTTGEEQAAALRLAAVSDEVLDYCEWHLTPVVTETVTVDGSGSDVQPLPTAHLLDVIAVISDGYPVDLTGLQWSAAGYLKVSGVFSSRLRGVTATITHGYAATPPAVAAMICEAVKRGMANPGGVVREASGGESVTYATVEGGRNGGQVPAGAFLLERETRILDRRYRIVARP